MQYIEVHKIEEILKIAIKNIKIHFRTINGRSGWHQYLGSEKIGNIATAQALLLLNYCNEDFDNKHLAFEFLKNNQQKNTGDSLIDGGWTYVTNFSELPTTECTCWTLLALHNPYLNNNVAIDGIKWLLNNLSNLNNDSGWGTIKSDVPRVYSTCLALRVLQKYGYSESNEFSKALNWLIKSQNTDLGWGEQFGYKSTIFHTSFAINTLLDIYNSNNSIISNGVIWLKTNFNNAIENTKFNIGSQEIIDFNYTINNFTKHQRLIYFHTPLPNAVIALIRTGNIFNENVFTALNEIIDNNNNGYWRHQNFDNSIQKPLWLIYDMVCSLKIFTLSFQNWKDINRVVLSNNKLSIISSNNPFHLKNFISKFVLGIWGKFFVILLACVFVIFLSEKFPNLTTKSYMALVLLPLIVELLGYYLTEIKTKK